MRLLLLGGTGFLGRAVARSALAGGAEVTCLARGSDVPADGVRFLAADRDNDDALAPLAGQEWDAVVDVATRPGHVRRAVRDLDTRHYVFVSSASVYASFCRPEQDEQAEVLPPLVGDEPVGDDLYGPAKVACEQAVRDRVSSWTIVRPGLIGGRGDRSGRSGYYPWRFAHPTGPDVLVPPDLECPVALIDVQDLAEWIVHCAGRGVHGVFNATGPTVTLGEFLATARAVAGGTALPRPVPAGVLADAGVGQWMGPNSLPLWIDDPDWRWFATLDTAAARRHGLRLRPLAATLAAALDDERRSDRPRQAGLTADEERQLRALLEGDRDAVG